MLKNSIPLYSYLDPILGGILRRVTNPSVIGKICAGDAKSPLKRRRDFA